MKLLLQFLKINCLLLVVWTSINLSSAQVMIADSTHQSSRENSLFIELGGNAGRYSLNYQRVLLQGKRTQYEARVGASYWRPDGVNYVVVLAEAMMVRGLGRNKWETGLGVVHGMGGRGMNFGFETPAKDQTHPTFRFGYRRELSKDFFFKASGMVILRFPWIGLAVGRHF